MRMSIDDERDREVVLRVDVADDELLDDAERVAAEQGEPDRGEASEDRCGEAVDRQREVGVVDDRDGRSEQGAAEGAERAATANAITAIERTLRPTSSAARGESAEATSACPTIVRRRKKVRPTAAAIARRPRSARTAAARGRRRCPRRAPRCRRTSAGPRRTSRAGRPRRVSAMPTVMTRLARCVVRPRMPTATTAVTVASSAERRTIATTIAGSSGMCCCELEREEPPRTAKTPWAKLTIPVVR